MLFRDIPDKVSYLEYDYHKTIIWRIVGGMARLLRGQRGRGAEGMEREPVKSHKDLEVYQMAFDTAMKIFELSKKFPVEERKEAEGQRRWGAEGLRINKLVSRVKNEN